MTDKIRFFLFLILLLAVTYVVVKIPLNLGLDLQGGMRLVLEAQDTTSVKVDDNAMLGVIAVVRNRVDGLGVSEPIIARKGTRQVVVELPGITDPQRAIKLIGETALMEFVEAEWLPGVAGTISTEDLKVLGGEGSRLEMHIIKDNMGNIVREIPIILKKTVMSGNELKWAGPGVDEYGKPLVNIEFTPEGAKKFADVTRRNVGKPLAILLDGTIISAPNINGPIPGGKAQISGSFSLEEVQDLVVKLKAGSLPVPISIVEQKEVGPTLGKDSINKSIKAGIIGYIFVSIFMILFYRYLGFVAIVSLLIYILLDLAAFSILHVVLTLPGIAGIVLSIGIAVDANVLIFERFKEERSTGKTVMNALEMGFKRAMITIMDSNITTLITAFVLFWLGTGSIKGFAVTLSTGIVVSMFTALVLTRFFLFSTLKIRAIRENKFLTYEQGSN
ncbi:MAG: protein-export membrane protein SecD [Candidatus Margulisbacteria bacterium GWF2_35_9]|nr:MAG: protein-export membrane protein SecD [Candidatus Margulisbacteria bacterium GWF2_35_9]